MSAYNWANSEAMIASCDEADFVWQVTQSPFRFETVSTEDRDSRLKSMLDRFVFLCEATNVRFLAAVSYFHRAVKLQTVGSGPSDFAGESIVNLAKVLEVLFNGDNRDATRVGLRKLGFSDELIESAFVPCLLLCSRLDAAHVGLANLTAPERNQLQEFTSGVY